MEGSLLIFVVGIGPGHLEHMTLEAKEAVENCDVLVGYDVYVDLVRELAPEKEVITTGMTREVERCQLALSEALKGKTVALVCSGDAGVYGMAGVMLEVAEPHPEVEIHIIAGVTAATSVAARLGAPLTHDFAVISLSDLLTPWEKIEKRLLLASEADFVICLYNPRSKKRTEHLNSAVHLIGIHRAKETPCGYVKNAGREDEFAEICTLSELADKDIDMFTTIIIGNSKSKTINGRLVTPRGYKGI